ncbi:hypothetical protein EV424DRAFT_1355123 [Suillus variegatus]|nr:hypothetical protein EV424DRAFT_1355123 [Suillus variegatus]
MTMHKPGLNQQKYEAMHSSTLGPWTCHELQQVGAECVLARFDDILKPFVGEHMAKFRYSMHTTAAVINGSCARQMLWADVQHPTNLNIIVPKGCSLSLIALILETLKYDRTQNTHINEAYKKVIARHSKFRCGPLRITVSEAFADGIFQVIASSHTTADMTVMTTGGLTAFYPLWTSKGIVVTNHSDTQINAPL